MKRPLLVAIFCLALGFAIVYSTDIYHFVRSHIHGNP